ncbi:hypothetical protein HaLaN_06853 [Haematococcus lacustris]|uniref:Uncharacterized protein n=1 Tax=Haematococcus lacustris TaxID=44745 RepID=A0A699YUJ3_HAELA|nr:hypothetical protein HaLaN_06853 [Haematococcus lacustris]
MAEASMECHGRAKQLVVVFGAASIGTRGRWGADAVLRACCKVVCRLRGIDHLRGMVVLADEHRTTRVSSAVNGQQPCESQLNKCRATRRAGWKPPAGQVDLHILRPAWSQQRDQRVRGLMYPVVPGSGPPQAPTGPKQQPGNHTASSLRARAEHSPSSQAQQAHQGCQSQASTTARQVAGQGVNYSIEHAAHWGEQVAPAGAVLVTRAGEAASQGQGCKASAGILAQPALQRGQGTSIGSSSPRAQASPTIRDRHQE